jgi:hypothetical protein
MTPVFLDTVGLLALWNVAYQWHTAAERAYQQIVSARQPSPLALLRTDVPCPKAVSRIVPAK